MVVARRPLHPHDVDRDATSTRWCAAICGVSRAWTPTWWTSPARLCGRLRTSDFVHEFTEKWKREQEGKTLDELVRVGLAVRADTLALLAELTDEQLASKIPGAPWADGTVGGVLSIHAAHRRMHRQWSEAGTPA